MSASAGAFLGVVVRMSQKPHLALSYINTSGSLVSDNQGENKHKYNTTVQTSCREAYQQLVCFCVSPKLMCHIIPIRLLALL